ncbi:MAG TPA: bifunctional DNA primase/polymerase [Polyangiaceae bacterium]|nr:bifunctional DNA primase/polymerase [Polyangiaceae bacterium]
MTEPALVHQLAEVFEFDSFAFAHLSDAERAVVLARRAAAQPRTDHSWSKLEWIAQTDKRDALRICARLGLHVHLLHGVDDRGRCTCGRKTCTGKSRGKHPINDGWEVAPFDLNRVDFGLIEDPRRNLGVRMGPQPGGYDLICIDIDGPMTLLEPLEARFGKLPPTLTATSGNGFHLFFKWPSGVELPSNTKLAGVKEIDVRSRRGQVVIAPSRHYSGRSYKWVRCIEPAEIELE